MRTRSSYAVALRPRSIRAGGVAFLLKFIGLLILMPWFAHGMEGRLILPDGRPAAGSQVSIPGVPGSVRADQEGRFTIAERTEGPFTLIIIGARGEIFPPVTIVEHPAGGVVEIHLEPGLREVVTVTSGVAPNIESPPASGTTVIGREEIEERRPEHLVDALIRTPGIQVRGEGPSAVPVLRGLAGGRTLILLDDARVTAERRAGPSGTFLDPFILGSVEVSRGPGSVAYGSDALGGVIHARPRDPVVGHPSLLYEVSGGFGGRDLRSGGVEFTHDLGPGAILAVIHTRRGDESQAANGDPIPNSSYQDRGAALRYLLPSNAGTFRFALALDQARDVGAPAADATVQPTYYPEEDSSRFTMAWDWSPGGNFFDTVETRLALGSYDITTVRERLPNPTTTRQISSAEVSAGDSSLRLAASRLGTGGRLRTGIDYVTRFGLNATGFIQQFSSTDSPTTRTEEASIDDASKKDLGAYLIYDWDVAKSLMLSGGVRMDRVESENRGGFFGDHSREDTAASGYASLSFTPFRGLTATAQAASGYRDPTLSDRFFRGISGRGFVVGNPELEPERSLQFDGALRWHIGRRSLGLFGYHYRIDDLIERFRNGADFNFRNRGQAEIKGFELEAAAPLWMNFSLAANASIARGEAVDDGTPLDDIAAPNGHVALRWASSRGSAFLYVFHFAEDHRPGPVEATRPSYTTVDLGFGWRFSEMLEVRLSGRNLTDELYAGSADANASLAPGRSFTIGINGRIESGEGRGKAVPPSLKSWIHRRQSFSMPQTQDEPEY